MRRTFTCPRLRLLAVVFALILLMTASACEAQSAAESEPPERIGLVVDESAPPKATGYYGAPLSEFEITGVVMDAESGRHITGAWCFAEDQALVVPQEGVAYTAVFTPRHEAEQYEELSVEIVPTVQASAPDYRTLTAEDVPALIAGEVVLDDLKLGKGTIYPSGTMYWLDERGQVLDGSSRIEKNRVYLWKFVADGTDGLTGIEAGWSMEGRVTLWPSFISGAADADYGGITYKLYVPDGYAPGENVPVYMYLHGCRASIDSALYYTGLDALAEAENFLVLMPQQSKENNRSRCWSWFERWATAEGNLTRTGGEPECLVAILKDICRLYSVDTEKIFVGGLSAGGYMANILAVTYPDVFSGVMVNAGGAYSAERTYNEADIQMNYGIEAATGQTLGELAEETLAQMGEYARVIPMVVVQGTGDATVCPQNGLDTAQCWAEIMSRIDADISAEPVVTTGEENGGTYTLYTYYDQADGTPVIKLYMVDGLSHTYATATAKAPDAAGVSYRFFMEK